MEEESGRAIKSGNIIQQFPFPLRNFQNSPSNHRVDYNPKIVYASSVNQRKVKLEYFVVIFFIIFSINFTAIAQDRYTPGQAYAFTHRNKFKKECKKQFMENN